MDSVFSSDVRSPIATLQVNFNGSMKFHENLGLTPKSLVFFSNNHWILWKNKFFVVFLLHTNMFFYIKVLSHFEASLLINFYTFNV